MGGDELHPRRQTRADGWTQPQTGRALASGCEGPGRARRQRGCGAVGATCRFSQQACPVAEPPRHVLPSTAARTTSLPGRPRGPRCLRGWTRFLMTSELSQRSARARGPGQQSTGGFLLCPDTGPCVALAEGSSECPAGARGIWGGRGPPHRCRARPRTRRPTTLGQSVQSQEMGGELGSHFWSL